jgi:hypothetical protein
MRNANELLMGRDARCCRKKMNERQGERKKKNEEGRGRWR